MSKKLHEENIFKSGRDFYREMPNGLFSANDGRTLRNLPPSARDWSMLWAKDMTYMHLQLDCESQEPLYFGANNGGMYVYETILDESWLACITDKQLNTEQEWFMVTKVHMGLD